MENLASREYKAEFNAKVKAELKTAGIPAVKVGLIDNEVKTYYIGILNGFVFTRAWTYWVVKGYMPLEYAEYLYRYHKDLNIRVAGHCGNPSPSEFSECRNSDEIANAFVEKVRNGEMSWKEAEKEFLVLNKQGEQFVTMYHIDTQEGLNKFVEAIKSYNIQSDIIED